MSYADKERKSTRNWFVGASVVVLAILLLFVTNNGLYPHYWYQKASELFTVGGWIATACWYFFVWWYFPKYRNKYQWVEESAMLVVFGGIALIICLFAGFNFPVDR